MKLEKIRVKEKLYKTGQQCSLLIGFLELNEVQEDEMCMLSLAVEVARVE